MANSRGNKNGNGQGGVKFFDQYKHGWRLASSSSTNSSYHDGLACKYCGKTNHRSDRCFFKTSQPRKNAYSSQQNDADRHDADQQDNTLKEICNYCGKNGHIEADCRQKKKNDIWQNNQQDKHRPHNGSSHFCTCCQVHGPLLANGNSQEYSHKDTATWRATQGNTPWQYGNQRWTASSNGKLAVDNENDAIMCDCDGSSTGACLHNSRSKRGPISMQILDQYGLPVYVPIA